MNREFRYAVEHSLVVPCGAAIALVWANWSAESYFRFANALAFAVNDVGMAMFFAVMMQEVLEATMVGGALHTWRRAMLPIVAAIGGTIGAIGAYEAVVLSGDERLLAAGWPIVCAIDGGLMYLVVQFLLGKGDARPFVALMVIVSNAIGLIVIGLHQQSANVQWAGPLLIGSGLIVSIALKRLRVRTIWLHVVISGAFMWWGFWWSGLHPALALVPIVPFLPRAPRGLTFFVDSSPHDSSRHLEHVFRIPEQIILLLFALVNGGAVVHAVERGAWAVPAGAFIGRPIGTLVAVGIAVWLGLRLPARLGRRELVVIACAASCSFTFGLFFTTAVFPLGPVLTEAKVGALSTLAGVLLAIAAAWLFAVGRFSSGILRPPRASPKRQGRFRGRPVYRE